MISNNRAALFRIILAVTFLTVSTLSTAGQFYVGAQATTLTAYLDYANGSESYKLDPVRLEMGWKARNFYWAVQVLSSGRDTDIDLYGTTYEMKLATSYGVVVGLNSRYFYVGLGLQSFDTTYHDIPTTTVDKSNILTLGVQLGVQHEVVPNLSFYLDFSAYAGTADYAVFSANPDFSVRGFAGGMKYAF
jgi:hypothetical protein